jgi:hypothetical protein
MLDSRSNFMFMLNFLEINRLGNLLTKMATQWEETLSMYRYVFNLSVLKGV